MVIFMFSAFDLYWHDKSQPSSPAYAALSGPGKVPVLSSKLREGAGVILTFESCDLLRARTRTAVRNQVSTCLRLGRYPTSSSYRPVNSRRAGDLPCSSS